MAGDGMPVVQIVMHQQAFVDWQRTQSLQQDDMMITRGSSASTLLGLCNYLSQTPQCFYNAKAWFYT